jgi:outer membrane protein assembly factor BamB
MTLKLPGGFGLGIAAASAALGVALVLAQVTNVVWADDDPNSETHGFVVHKANQGVLDSLTEFERYRDKGAWEKAFAALGQAAEAEPGTLVPAADGFLLPIGQRLRQELISLPPAGLEAYRLFNDAAARKLFDQAQAAGGDDWTTLRRVVDRYFVTSIGDQAADRLADAWFESGRFAPAAALWQSILRDYPDTSLAPVRLLTKRAVALARAGDRQEFDAALSEIREKFAGQTVRIGGRDVVAEEFVAALKPTATTQQSDDDAKNSAMPLALPESDTPAWQMRFCGEDFGKQLEQQFGQFGWGGYASMYKDSIPATAMDAHRIYLDWFGATFAVDRRSGKLLWRTGKISDVPQQIQQTIMRGQIVRGADWNIAAGDGKVLAVALDTDALNQRNELDFRLTCMAGDTGKKLWSSATGSLAAWSFRGAPLVSGKTLYAVVVPVAADNSAVTLLAIEIGDGRLLWSLPLGTASARTDSSGQPVRLRAQMMQDGEALYVLTNFGALVAVDTTARELAWAFSFEILAASNNQVFFYNQNMPGSKPPGAMAIRGSMLYFKEQDRDSAFAIELAGASGAPSLAWRRTVDSDAMLAGLHGRTVYLLGEDAEGIDLDSKEMRWATPVFAESDRQQPLVAGNHLYTFVSRGMYEIDLSNGDVARIFRGYDRDSSGGALWESDGQLITVSNDAVTAYRLGTGAATRRGK